MFCKMYEGSLESLGKMCTNKCFLLAKADPEMKKAIYISEESDKCNKKYFCFFLECLY